MVASFVFSVLLLCVSISAEYTSFQWTDCGSDPSFQVHSINVSPMPVLSPGNLVFSVHITTTRPQLDRMILDISSKRDFGWFRMPLPCLLHAGSCTYDNTCTLIQTMKRENWAGVFGHIGAQIEQMLASVNITNYCGVSVPELRIQNFVLEMPPMPTILAFLAEGNYENKLRVLDHATNQVLICMDMKMSMKMAPQPCTNWFCRMRQSLSN